MIKKKKGRIRKQQIKIVIDLMMTVLLLGLMAYSLLGETLHEWAGITMAVLLLIHNGLNLKGYQNRFRGHGSRMRSLNGLVNNMIAVGMLLLMGSGIVLSRSVFSALAVKGDAALARTVHLAASYWWFVLISIHLGLHAKGLLAQIQHLLGIKLMDTRLKRIGKIFILLAGGYGCIALIRNDLPDYMLLKTEFVFFDFTKPLIFFFLDYLAVMLFFVLLGSSLTSLMTTVQSRNRSS